MTELDWTKVTSILELTPRRKTELRIEAIKTDRIQILYCAICHKLFKSCGRGRVGDIIVTCEDLNFHYRCFSRVANNDHEILKVENTSLKERIRQLEKERKFLLGLACA